MLSLQYLNKRLKKSHIEQILANYNIKYNTMKREIDNKINIMIKTFTQDISDFLNNMEEVAEEKEKLKALAQNQNELEDLREQMKEKIHTQTKLRREIELLRIENNRLKALSSNNTASNSRKKITALSPRSRDYNYLALHTMSNYHTPNVHSPIKQTKDNKSIISKADKKDKKEYKDNNLFRSPQRTETRKIKNKMNYFNFEESNNKKKVELGQQEKSKTLKNILSYSSSGILTLPNKKNINLTRNLTNKKKKNNYIFVNKNNKSGIVNKKDQKSGDKLLNKTISNFNKNKTINKNIVGSQTERNKDKEKENVFNSSSSSSENKYVTNNDENKSKITTEDNEDTMIDEEIREMNDIEDDILSLMDQIKEFKQENSNLT